MSVLEIQFVGDKNFFVGSDSVSVRGQILRIGPRELGYDFPYHSPQSQIEQFNTQQYVLLAAYDDKGKPVKHPDIGVRLDASNPYVEPGDEDIAPSGIHEHMTDLKNMIQHTPVEGPDAQRQEVEEEVKPKRKRAARKTTAKRTSRKKS